MLMSLTAPLFDLSGVLQLLARDADWMGETTRRVSRVATLDVDVVVQDRGYSDGDRTIDLRCPNVSLADYDRAYYLQRTYPRLNLSLPGGAFVAALERVGMSDTTLELKLMIIKRIG